MTTRDRSEGDSVTGEERTEAATEIQGSGVVADIPTDIEPPPERRLNLTLDLHADDLDAVYRALRNIATDIDHDGREEREQTSGGSDSGFHLTLKVTDPDMTAERYYERLTAWMDARRAARRA